MRMKTILSNHAINIAENVNITLKGPHGHCEGPQRQPAET